MFRIAICDDEHVICSQIEKIILENRKYIAQEIQIEIFYSGEKFCSFMENEHEFDLIFLDIEMELLNGVEVGKKIREEIDNQTTQIVYISGKDSYYLDMFEVRPMHFLSKPIEEDKIIQDVQLAIKLSDKLGGMFSFKKGYETYKIPIKDIIYFQSVDRKIKIVFTKGEDLFYAKLHDIFDQVEKYQFMMIHKSYIINYVHVTRFNYEEVRLSNSVKLTISQSKRKKTRELQVKYEKGKLV